MDVEYPFKFRYNENFFGKVGEQKSRFLHEKYFFIQFVLAPGYVRGPSFPAVSRHFGYPQKKYQKKSRPPPLMQYLKQPPS